MIHFIEETYFEAKTSTILIALDRDDTLIRDFGKLTNYFIPIINLPLYTQLRKLSKKYHDRIEFVIVTNQSRIGRGELKLNHLRCFHKLLFRLSSLLGVKISKIFICPHDARLRCKCRKPNIGLLEDYIKKKNFSKKIMIGNAISDMHFGINLKMTTYQVVSFMKKPIHFESCSKPGSERLNLLHDIDKERA